MLLYIANISDYKTPAIPVMTKIVEVSDMINNACREHAEIYWILIMAELN